MTAPDYAAFPERPPSEVEWEELLVRYEVTPRALRLAVDDAGPEHEDALREVLARALADEAATAGWLERARTRSPEEPADGAVSVEDADEAVERFTVLRGRNFAAVQRRGLEVWEWTALLGGRRVTAYQLLSASVVRDGRVLAAVRAAARGAGAC